MQNSSVRQPTTSVAHALLEVRALRAHYQTRNAVVRAVDGVSLSVEPGEIVGIAGESGCGKSTLAAVLSLTARPPLGVVGGELELDGETVKLTDFSKVPRAWRGKQVALLPQGAMNSLNPTARVRVFARDVIRAHEPKVPPAEAVDRARSRLEQLSLPPRVLDSYPHQLSGGMRQRVVTAMSTLLNPKVLIADEPTSALDVSSQRELVKLLLELLRDGFIQSVVFITHDLPLLAGFADRIAIMYAGEICEIGTAGQVVHHPEHPYTKALVSSILVPEPEIRRRRVEGIAGQPPDLRNPPPGCRFHPRCPHAMDVCRTDEPPVIGDPHRYATCWWLEQQRSEVVR